MNSDLQSDYYYFNTRAHFSYYEETYKDYHEMNIWKEVISSNPSQFKDKVVFEVGTGPGLFTLLVARAGAQHIYTWEPSSIATSAIEIFKENQYQDKITVFQGPIENIKLDKKVDLVFTTSIGYGLMLNSLLIEFLFARDHFLKEGGVIIPSSAEIYLSTCVKSNFAYLNKCQWKNIYGFDFTPIEKDEINEACIDCVSKSRIMTDAAMICNLDFTKISVNDLTINSRFTLKPSNDQSFVIDRFIIWFILKFPTLDKNQKQIELSSSPYDTDTHFYQVAIKVPEIESENDENNRNENLINKNDIINGSISILHKENRFKPIMFRIQYSVNSPTEIKTITGIFE